MNFNAMIIYRYLVKEVLTMMFAMTAILLVIFLSTQFVHYLSAAALGRFTGQILLHIMLLQVPYLLGLLIPAGLFLALLLAYGRLYADREMIVLLSCGLTQRRLIGLTMTIAIIVTIIAAVLNMWCAPILATQQKMLFAEAKSVPLVDIIIPGRFFADNNGKNILYVEKISRNRQQMNNIFFAQGNTDDPSLSQWSLVLADQGYQTVAKNGDHYIVVNHGQRYQGVPGSSNFQIVSFDKYWLRVESRIPSIHLDEQTLSTKVLWQHLKNNPDAKAELQWRISLPISVLLLAFLAIPLSQVNPRQGRYVNILLAVLVYIIYANMMFLVRSWMQADIIPGWLGAWWLHALILILAIGLLCWQGNWYSRFWQRRNSTTQDKP